MSRNRRNRPESSAVEVPTMPIEDQIADVAERIARTGGTPSHAAIPLERVEMARAAGLDVEFIPTPIKVRELRLRSDVPITASNIVARSKDGVTIEIQFEPWQRHHRVRETDEETGRVRSEYCVPESWCLYVPLAEG